MIIFYAGVLSLLFGVFSFVEPEVMVMSVPVKVLLIVVGVWLIYIRRERLPGFMVDGLFTRDDSDSD